MPIDPITGSLISTAIGGLFSANAANTAADAQAAADAARLAEEKRVREQLRLDTEAQRAVADKAFEDYNAGLISYAEAQKRSADAMGKVQTSIANSQLSDTAKALEMSQFKPFSIRTGTGSTFFDQATGQTGFTLSPETFGYQQDLYKKAGEAVGGITTSPEEAAQRYIEQQQGLLQPGRQAEDIALRQQQLQRGRIGLGISSEAAGAGAGGYVNPEQFSRDRARAMADAQIAAQGTQEGQRQAANQLALAQGLFSAGMAPEQFGLNAITTGANIGNQMAGTGLNQANLYLRGMGDVYGNLLGAAGTAEKAAQYVPLANLTGAQEAYNRQQTYLGSLLGNTLPYQAMTMPQPLIPGSAYVMGGLGSGLMNAGMSGINQYFNPQPIPSAYGTPQFTGGQYMFGNNPMGTA